jgi:hypothetical protein
MAQDFDSLVSQVRDASEQLVHISDERAAALKRQLDAALRGLAPAPAQQPAAPQFTQNAQAQQPAEDIGAIVRREVQAALRAFATGATEPPPNNPGGQ